MGSNDRFDVFLSYARSDGAAAAELNNWLRTQGLRTFFDRSELRPGLRWITALEDAIGRSDAVAILVGPYGFGNTQQYERELALVRQTRDSGFPVIPVLLPGCENPPTGFLQLLTWIDLRRSEKILRQTESLDALRRAIQRQEVPPSATRAEICPYRGLEPFWEEDAEFFSGRDDAIRDLVAQVQVHSFVAVVGPSGSGKSSLVFAGLLPALRRQRQTMMWDVISFRPGGSPLRALAAAFGTVPENAGPAEIDVHLEKEAGYYRTGDADMLARIVNDRLDAAPEKPDRLLIYVDQWEELYAIAPAMEDSAQHRQHSDDVERFIALLVSATSRSRSRATVVLTVRADFYNPLIRNTLLSGLLPRQQVNIPPMAPSDLRSAIETPARKSGLSFVPPALIDQILNDVGTEEGRLPLLQFALKETWERREGARLTAEAYTEVGGVAGAIEETAKRAYTALTPSQQEAARRLFLRLVTPGEGQQDTRARSAIPDDRQQRDIVTLFSAPRTRLLVTGYETLQRPTGSSGIESQATVEVAHEELIRRWSTLRAWVDGNREKLRARTAILRAKAEWEKKGRIDKFLLDPGVQLERGRDLLDDPGDVPVDDICDYVVFSVEKENRRLDTEREVALAGQRRIADAERQAKEAAEEAARLSEAARAAAEVAARQLRKRLIQTALALGSAALAFGGASYQWSRADEQARETQRQLDRANRALAASILNEFYVKSNPALTARERNALWKLAVADEAVRQDFISSLLASPEDVVRVAPRFGEICRALGLQWPTPADAEKLLATAVVATDRFESPGIESLPIVFKTLAAKLTEPQVQQALDRLTQQIGTRTDSYELGVLADAFQAQAAKLTETQAQQTLELVLRSIGETIDPDVVRALAKGLQALPVKLTEAQAQQALDRLLGGIDEAVARVAIGDLDRLGLQAKVEGIHALPVKLTKVQAQLALDPLLRGIGVATDPSAIRALAVALQTLTAKLTEAQAQQASDTLVQKIAMTSDPYALEALAEALQALPVELTEAQAQQALDPLLQQIGEATSGWLKTLANTLQALAAKLTKAQAQQALAVAQSSLAWAATEDEALNWAHALLALLPRATDQGETSELVAAILYPSAAGPVTEVLLDALRAAHPKAPAKNAGTAASLAWVAETFPDGVRAPVCPMPPQATSISGLKCPLAGTPSPWGKFLQ